MQLIEVNGVTTQKAFNEVNVECNKNNSNYIRPLDVEVNAVFDKAKNKNYEHGNTMRWLLEDDEKIIGRIAAFTNTKYVNRSTDFPVGGIGFFDCIDNQDAANILFDKASEWLQQNGMLAMDGPINFGDRDKWWGLMVEGFEKPPIYGMAYNPCYYKRLFENYGFQNYYNQYYYAMKVEDKLPERFKQRYEKFVAKSDYSARHIKKENLQKHAEEFATVYNAAWAQHGEDKEVTSEQIMALLQELQPIIDERLIWFAYYKDEPIAMWINIPDLNEYFKHFNGRFGWFQKLKLLWLKKCGTCKIFTGVAFGVIPKFQALGIDSYMIYSGALKIQATDTYKIYEMGWAGDWNPKMLNIYKSLGAHQSRSLITYRYLFDKTRTFERHPIMS